MTRRWLTVAVGQHPASFRNRIDVDPFASPIIPAALASDNVPYHRGQREEEGRGQFHTVALQIVIRSTSSSVISSPVRS